MTWRARRSVPKLPVQPQAERPRRLPEAVPSPVARASGGVLSLDIPFARYGGANLLRHECGVNRRPVDPSRSPPPRDVGVGIAARVKVRGCGERKQACGPTRLPETQAWVPRAEPRTVMGRTGHPRRKHTDSWRTRRSCSWRATRSAACPRPRQRSVCGGSGRIRCLRFVATAHWSGSWSSSTIL